MKAKTVRRLYEDLSGEERYRLMIEVHARGDRREATHILQTTPFVEVRACDPAFANAAEGSRRLVSVFAHEAMFHLGWLRLVEALEEILTGESGRRHLPSGAASPVAAVLDFAAEEAARRLRALADAFEEACQEWVRCPGQDLLTFWTPEVALLMWTSRGWIEGLEADPEVKAQFRATLDEHWTLGRED